MARAGFGSKMKMAAIIVTLLVGAGFPIYATASPVLGQQIAYEGGHVTVTVLPYDAGYMSNLYLYGAGSPILIANSAQVGHVVNLGDLAALYNFKPGDELIFGIVVLNTGDTFVMGPGTRNADGLAHVNVDYAEGSAGDLAILGFEDLYGGGDRDYNDAIFRLEGGVGIKVPESASLILLVVGMAGLALVSRVRFDVGCREDARSARR